MNFLIYLLLLDKSGRAKTKGQAKGEEKVKKEIG